MSANNNTVAPLSYPLLSLQPNFKPVDHLFEDRLRQFTDEGQYRELNLPHFYDRGRVDTNTEWINIKVYRVPDKDGKTQRPLFKDIDFDAIEWEDANKGYSFGPSWKTFWFKVEWEIPGDWLDKEEIHFEWDCGNEGLIYTEKGLPLQAFSGNGERILFKLPKKYFVSGIQRFYLEIACNGMFGISDQGNPDPNRYFQLTRCDLVLPNITARKLRMDFWILSDAAREFPGEQWQKWKAGAICNDIMDAFDPEDESSLDVCREIALKFIGKDVDSDEVFHVKTFKGRIDVFGVGNCHIDTAWLWPFAETKRKIVRSWTSQLNLCDDYPEYIFVASQMQQFKWLKKYHPEILKLIHKKFEVNQFLPIGGLWVENDTNLPNGESLIRQFLLGQQFQYDEFGIKADVFWLPDTFGYSSQIPQICQTVGINKFVTQKLSWNNINTFPLSTFNWVGIDGSQVLVHMPPANTYTAEAHFGDVLRSQRQHKNLRDVPTGLLLFGKGDGGGGPIPDMLERLRRCRGVSNEVGLLPTVQLGNTVEDFFEQVLKDSKQGTSLPSWVGEIYLEFHRGTYTTQADIKKYMRTGEIKLHDLEWIATLLSVQSKYKYKYPRKELQKLWEDLCLCQFHDVLPGSCIGMVYYEEAKPMLRKVLAKADKLIKEAIEVLTKKEKEENAREKVKEENGQSEEKVKGEGNITSQLGFINTLPWKRHEIVAVPDASKITINNYQVSVDNQHYVSVSSSSELSTVNALLDIKYKASVKKEGSVYVLANDLLKATISEDGIITSLYDLENEREVIDTTSTKQTGSGVVGGNQLILFDDEPLSFPAWDTELYSLNKFKLLKGGKVSIKENGPLKSSVVVKYTISSQSSIETEISIEGIHNDADVVQNNFIKFSSDVVWHETYKFLKVQFPTTIHTAPDANYETQFGITRRPTHWNTSWDVAKFEVCHHKFMDLSEFNYGVSILNDSKYGGAIHGNLIRLSLLRSPKAPDEKADMGNHHFEYAIYPHAGSLGVDTVKLGYNFNHKITKPLLINSSVGLGKLVTLESKSDSLVLSQIKRGERDEEFSSIYPNIDPEDLGNSSIIVRIYEALGGSSTGKLTINLPFKAVYKTNSLEEKIEEVKASKEGIVDVKLRGFGIATYKIVL